MGNREKKTKINNQDKKRQAMVDRRWAIGKEGLWFLPIAYCL
jgi:hypothetical protein